MDKQLYQTIINSNCILFIVKDSLDLLLQEKQEDDNILEFLIDVFRKIDYIDQDDFNTLNHIFINIFDTKRGILYDKLLTDEIISDYAKLIICFIGNKRFNHETELLFKFICKIKYMNHNMMKLITKIMELNKTIRLNYKFIRELYGKSDYMDFIEFIKMFFVHNSSSHLVIDIIYELFFDKIIQDKDIYIFIETCHNIYVIQGVIYEYDDKITKLTSGLFQKLAQMNGYFGKSKYENLFIKIYEIDKHISSSLTIEHMQTIFDCILDNLETIVHCVLIYYIKLFLDLDIKLNSDYVQKIIFAVYAESNSVMIIFMCTMNELEQHIDITPEYIDKCIHIVLENYNYRSFKILSSCHNIIINFEHFCFIKKWNYMYQFLLEHNNICENINIDWYNKMIQSTTVDTEIRKTKKLFTDLRITNFTEEEYYTDDTLEMVD